MNISLNSLNKFFNRFYLAGFLILSMGIPLTFSSLTRSVFEGNKLLLLRIVIIIIYGAWILKSCLLKDNQLTPPTKYSYKILGFSWRRIGLEIPILLWIITNLISIIFSENIFVGYIGAYDRWESLATILNYVLLFYMTAKLIDSTRYRLLIFSIFVFSTSISSIYGVIQSLGVDFMNWSRSPTDRVFACINNPVHFCAYVGMTVPIGIGLMFYSLNNLSKKALSFTTSNAVVYTSIVSLILVLCSFLTFKSLPSLIFTVLFALGAYALYFYTTIKPSKTNIVHFSLFGLVYLSTRLLGLYTLDRFQTTALIFGLIILYCISAIKNKYLPQLFTGNLSTKKL